MAHSDDAHFPARRAAAPGSVPSVRTVSQASVAVLAALACMLGLIVGPGPADVGVARAQEQDANVQMVPTAGPVGTSVTISHASTDQDCTPPPDHLEYGELFTPQWDPQGPDTATYLDAEGSSISPPDAGIVQIASDCSFSFTAVVPLDASPGPHTLMMCTVSADLACPYWESTFTVTS